jgi:MFS family permease
VPDLPVIARQFHVPPEQIGLVITALTLPGVVFVLFFGVLADRYGRKVLMVPSLAIFGIAGGLIYWANDFFTIAALRMVQGVGSAILPSMSTMLIGDLFEEKDRLKMMGMNSAVLSVGTAFFPFVGGVLATVDWKTPFLAFWGVVPVALFMMVYFKEPKVHKPSGMKAYFKMSLGHLLKKSTILAYATGLAIFILLYGGILTYLTLFMDNRFHMDAYHIGLYIATASFATAWFAPFASRLEARFGVRLLFIAGFALFAVSFFSVLFVTRQEWIIASILVFGAAMGLTVPLLQNIVIGLAPFEHRGVMVSMLAMLIRLGQTVGPAMLGLLIIGGDLRPIFAACGGMAALFAVIILVYGNILRGAQNGPKEV